MPAVEPVTMIEAPAVRCGSDDADGVQDTDQIDVDAVDEALHRVSGPSSAVTPALATTMSSWPNSASPASSAASSSDLTRTSPLVAAMIRGPVGLDLFDRLRQVLRRRQRVVHAVERLADVDGDDVGALLGQPDRVAAALTARRARDECDLAFELAHVGANPLVSARQSASSGESVLDGHCGR